MADYRLVSADSHVNEPPGVWRDRVPAEFRDRAPRIESFDEGDAWVIEGVQDPINFGWNACSGLAPEEMSTMRPPVANTPGTRPRICRHKCFAKSP